MALVKQFIPVITYFCLLFVPNYCSQQTPATNPRWVKFGQEHIFYHNNHKYLNPKTGKSLPAGVYYFYSTYTTSKQQLTNQFHAIATNKKDKSYSWFIEDKIGSNNYLHVFQDLSVDDIYNNTKKRPYSEDKIQFLLSEPDQNDCCTVILNPRFNNGKQQQPQSNNGISTFSNYTVNQPHSPFVHVSPSPSPSTSTSLPPKIAIYQDFNNQTQLYSNPLLQQQSNAALTMPNNGNQQPLFPSFSHLSQGINTSLSFPVNSSGNGSSSTSISHSGSLIPIYSYQQQQSQITTPQLQITSNVNQEDKIAANFMQVNKNFANDYLPHLIALVQQHCPGKLTEMQNDALQRADRNYARQMLINGIETKNMHFFHRALQNTNIDINGNNNEKSPLEIVISKGNLEMAEYLLAAKADINRARIDPHGFPYQTPLEIACTKNFPTTIHFLLSKKADITAAVTKGYHAILTNKSDQNTNIAILKKLLQSSHTNEDQKLLASIYNHLTKGTVANRLFPNIEDNLQWYTKYPHTFPSTSLLDDQTKHELLALIEPKIPGQSTEKIQAALDVCKLFVKDHQPIIAEYAIEIDNS